MQIFVKTLSSTMTLDVDSSDSILSLKEQMQGRGQPAPEDHRLVFGGKTLVDGNQLCAYNIQAESTLHQVMSLNGGHCQVPCGIFDDPKLVQEMKEACATVRKALEQMNELHAKKDDLQAFNQMTRWVMTKEDHCKKIITTISEYCLCQRVKPVGAPKSPFKNEKDFLDALVSHHNVMVAAMKAKQTCNLAAADALEHAVGDWAKMYLPM